MEELKTCPFCGKPAKRYFGNVIGCTDVVNCGAQIESSDHGENTFAFTRDSWNRRVKNESLRAEVEALRAALQRIADRRYDLCPTKIVHIVNTALRGEGE